MGLFDLFTGGSGPDKARKLKEKATQKYGDAQARQKALQQLAEMDIPEAVSALMARFTVAVEPATTDEDEKEHVFDVIKAKGENAIEPVRQFLLTNDSASSWALRILEAILPEADVIGVAIEVLNKLGAGYTRDPEKKVVMLTFLEERQDTRIAPAVLPFLEDMADDVKIAAVRVLLRHKRDDQREPLLNVLTNPETAKRVQTAIINALVETGFGVQGYREKVEALIADPYFVDKNGILKKRG